MQTKFIIGFIFVFVAYLIIKAYFAFSQREKIVENEINEVLNSDKYKVKGQYD